MSDLMRKEFEVWAESRGMDLYCSRKNIYVESETLWAWSSWKASRECLVIELPNRFDEKYQDYYDDVEGGCFNECRYINDVHASLEAAGVKYK